MDVTSVHIKRYFYWKGISDQVRSYCQSCQTCVAAKPYTGKIPGFLTPAALPPGPNYKLHGDTMRGLPPCGGFRHVLVVQCSFSKMVFTVPIALLGPTPVIEGLSRIFTAFGQPQLFIADRGTEFHNEYVCSFLGLWGVAYMYSESYNP